jgi:hypothetical protein
MGMAMLFVGLLIVYARPPAWQVFSILSFFCVVTSGCRSALLGMFAAWVAMAVRRVPYWKLLAPLLAVVTYIAYIGVSWKEMSGREIQGEGRLDTWSDALGSLASPLDWIVGAGLGALSNSAVTYGVRGVAVIGDSSIVSIIGSYGVIGLLVFGWLFLRLWVNATPRISHTFFPATLVCALSFYVVELPVVATLLPLLMGLANDGLRSRLVRRTSGVPNGQPVSTVEAYAKPRDTKEV